MAVGCALAKTIFAARISLRIFIYAIAHISYLRLIAFLSHSGMVVGILAASLAMSL
jgi:hypothetical protein